MNESHPELVLLEEVLARLQLQIASEDKAYGEIQGSPVALTVLAVEPLALLLGFKIRSPHPAQIGVPSDIAWLVSEKKAEVSLEKGIAWFSLDDLSAKTAGAIEGLITSFARALADAEVRLPDGCVQCGSTEEVALVYSEGRCSRLCADCRDRIVIDTVKEERELNRPSLWYALALPLMFLYVSCAWTLLWWLVDLMLLWANTDTIKLGGYDFVLIIIVLAVIGGVTGYPIGVILRRSGIPGRTHWIASSLAVLVACAAGEWLFFATLLYRQIGLFDLVLAARFVGPFVSDYHPSWMASKVMVAGAIGIGCHCGAQWRTAAVKL